MSNNLTAIKRHWKSSTLDIRKTRNARWYDQKITPDILATICGVIQDFCQGNQTHFTIKDLWGSQAFVTAMQQNFGKPAPQNRGARSEYDKVIAQPLNVLHYAGILLNTGGKRSKKFLVNPQFVILLAEIADNESGAANFLTAYVREVLERSNFLNIFDAFFNQQNQQSFDSVKKEFSDFLIQHTPINQQTECNRIFAKVLNIQAYALRKRGAEAGKMSDGPISLGDIRYNRINFRDKTKPKHIPRQQASGPKFKGISDSSGPPSSRFVRKTIEEVKKHHGHKSEIQDQHAETPSVQGHHIFRRADYPKLTNYRENIIILSPTQHVGHAHGNNTYNVSEGYQLLCLQKKLDAVEECENDPNCNFYSFQDFKRMLVEVGIINIDSGTTKLPNLGALKPDDVRRILAEHYTTR